VCSEPWYGAAGQYSWLTTQFEGDRMSMVRRWLVVAAGLFAVAELIDGIVYRLLPGIVFGVVLGLCTWWASRSRGWAPSAVLGVLAAVEFLLVVFVYSRGEDPAAWWRLVLYGVLSLAVTVVSGVDLVHTLPRRRPRPQQRRA
jgi:peptidoglycan/LPS O-acetylase OafA/YrhL